MFEYVKRRYNVVECRSPTYGLDDGIFSFQVENRGNGGKGRICILDYCNSDGWEGVVRILGEFFFGMELKGQR